MSRTFIIKNLSGVNWRSHDDFEDYIRSGCILNGEQVKVENKDECPLPLEDNEYCLIFANDKLFVEELFTLDECVLLFGEEFLNEYQGVK